MRILFRINYVHDMESMNQCSRGWNKSKMIALKFVVPHSHFPLSTVIVRMMSSLIPAESRTKSRSMKRLHLLLQHGIASIHMTLTFRKLSSKYSIHKVIVLLNWFNFIYILVIFTNQEVVPETPLLIWIGNLHCRITSSLCSYQELNIIMDKMRMICAQMRLLNVIEMKKTIECCTWICMGEYHKKISNFLFV